MCCPAVLRLVFLFSPYSKKKNPQTPNRKAQNIYRQTSSIKKNFITTMGEALIKSTTINYYKKEVKKKKENLILILDGTMNFPSQEKHLRILFYGGI